MQTYESSKWSFRFNDLVVLEMLIGVPDEDRIGRLVQVRKGVGAFKSDTLLVRRRDGSLMSFHNVMVRPAADKQFEENFYLSNGAKPPVIHPDSEYPMDEPGAEYSIANAYPETGFVIERPSQPDDAQQSFAMRVISK